MDDNLAQKVYIHLEYFKKEMAPKICEEMFAELVFVNTSRIFEEALSIDRETGSRAADSFLF